MNNTQRSSHGKTEERAQNLDPVPDEDLRSTSRHFSFSSYLYESDNCSSSVSDTSTISWTEQDFDGLERGAALLQLFDEALYTDKSGVGELGEECEQWKKRFLHLRVEGKSISVPKSQARPDSPTAEEEEVLAVHATHALS